MLKLSLKDLNYELNDFVWEIYVPKSLLDTNGYNSFQVLITNPDTKQSVLFHGSLHVNNYTLNIARSKTHYCNGFPDHWDDPNRKHDKYDCCIILT